MKRSAVILLVLAAVARPGARAEATAGERLILEPTGDTILRVEGIYPRREGVCEAKQPKPLRAKYRGRLDLVLEAGGRLRILNTLSFSHYLRGLAEVPLSWPTAALRAQVIAARSYALSGLRSGGRYDICATDRCQVYRGAAVELGAFGEQWVRAVRATEGKALTRGGRVIRAFYFSTSDGRTRRAFPGGSPAAYLRATTGEDADAPLARWTVRLPLGDLGAILRVAGVWSGGAIESVTYARNRFAVSGGGRSASLAPSELRVKVNAEAPCLFPNRYPGPSRTGSRLPQTIPSTSFRAGLEGTTLVLRGRGWGHFVGMSQYGARSLAERGRSATQILSHFYAARVTAVEEPERIRVLAAEALQRVRIQVDGAVRVRTGTGSLLSPGRTFEVRGGRALRVRRARGRSLEPVLDVRATPGTPPAAKPGETASLRFTLSHPARVTAEVLRDGARVAEVAEASFERGEQTLAIALRDGAGAALAPGSYEVVLTAYDGIDRVRSAPVALTVLAPPRPPPPPPRPSRALPVGLAALALLLGAGTLARRARASRR